MMLTSDVDDDNGDDDDDDDDDGDGDDDGDDDGDGDGDEDEDDDGGDDGDDEDGDGDDVGTRPTAGRDLIIVSKVMTTAGWRWLAYEVGEADSPALHPLRFFAFSVKCRLSLRISPSSFRLSFSKNFHGSPHFLRDSPPLHFLFIW